MVLRPHSLRGHTLVELTVASAIFAMLGSVVYGVASEGLFAFSRNISINRSYGEARGALERIGGAFQTAGYKPQLIDASGALTTDTPAAGMRFWTYDSYPCYNITTPTLTATSLTVSLVQPGTSLVQPPPTKGDLITIAALGFQAPAGDVSVPSNNSVTVKLAKAVSNYCTVSSIPTQTTDKTAKTIQYSCLDWNPVAVVAVGTQLRYYPRFIPGTTDMTVRANYKILANLASSVGGKAPPLPFSLGPSPSVNVDLYAEAPDYNNRNFGSANTYTFHSSAFSPRNPSLLANPY